MRIEQAVSARGVLWRGRRGSPDRVPREVVSGDEHDLPAQRLQPVDHAPQERWSEGDRLGGVGEQGADVGEELGPLLAVYYAVVYGQR